MSAARRRHEIDHRRAAAFSLEFGFEDEGAGMISPSRCRRRVFWGNKPAPVIGVPPSQARAAISARNFFTVTSGNRADTRTGSHAIDGEF
jgi:hypothetical protein